MNKQLIYIVNQGCDASTRGLIEIETDKLSEYIQHIKELNKNSYYGCMPKIYLYKVEWDWFREVNPDDLKDSWDDNYVEQEDRLYYNDKIYTNVKDKYLWEIECDNELQLN